MKEGKAVAPECLSPTRQSPGPELKSGGEGSHYRLLYSGSKLYWRTGSNIDFDIYYHVIPHAVEVVPFDSDKSKEFDRLYFDYTKLLDNVEQAVLDGIKQKRQELKEQVAKDKFQSNTVVYDEVLLEEARQLAISSFLLNRLQLIGAPNSNIEYTMGGGDVADNNPKLDKQPVALLPVQVNRRRKTSTEEITQTMNNFQADYADLKAATAKAEKISNLVFEGANMLTSLGKAHAKDELALSKLSYWAKKWRWSIRMIIRRKHVAEMTVVIVAWEKKLAEKKAIEDAAKPLTVAEKRMSVVQSTKKPSRTRRSFDGKV